MSKQYEVGQTVWVVPLERHWGTPRAAKVTKIGRKWVNETITRLQANLARAVEVMGPFAVLAQPINGEPGRPSPIDVLTANGASDELELRSHVAISGSASEVINAADFRRLAEVHSSITQPSDVGEEDQEVSQSQPCDAGPHPREDFNAQPSAALTLVCEKCGRSQAYERSIDPGIPAWVATLSQSHCDADGCDTGDRLIETWLDASGVARDPAESDARTPLPGRPEGPHSAGLAAALKRAFDGLVVVETEALCGNCNGLGVSGVGLDVGGCDDCGGTGVEYGCDWDEDAAWRAVADEAVKLLCPTESGETGQRGSASEHSTAPGSEAQAEHREDQPSTITGGEP